MLNTSFPYEFVCPIKRVVKVLLQFGGIDIVKIQHGPIHLNMIFVNR